MDEISAMTNDKRGRCCHDKNSLRYVLVGPLPSLATRAKWPPSFNQSEEAKREQKGRRMDGIIFHSKALSVSKPQCPPCIPPLPSSTGTVSKFSSPSATRVLTPLSLFDYRPVCHPPVHHPSITISSGAVHYFSIHNIEEKCPQGLPSASFILPCCCLPVMPCSSRLDYL